MADQAAADSDDLPADSDEVEESWLRAAVRPPPQHRADRPQLPMNGDVIDGKYRIEGLLGRGGMGAVFRATHVVSEKAVALKWLLSSVSDVQAQRRFVREARAVGRIDHPNVVSLYDVCLASDHAYLVMELLHGESLRARLARGALAPSVAIDLLVPAMRGVAAAHRAGVVHRDLKPDNVFLCEAPDGAPREAKVLDFGVSSISAVEIGDSTLTKAGTVLGSPAYMSPEQLRDPHTVDALTDIYAFGIILYEALAGLRPFPAENHAALIAQIDRSAPEPLVQVSPDLPAELGQVVLRAFARQPAMRHPNMESLIAALLPFGDDS